MSLLRLRLWVMVALLVLVWHYRGELMQRIEMGMVRLPPIDEALSDKVRQVIGYRLDSERWLEFPLGANGNLIRVLTNGEFDDSVISTEEDSWGYTLSYRLIDGEGQTVLAGDYDHFTRSTQFQLPADERYHRSAFYRVGQLALSDTRIFPLNAIHQQRPLSLQLRLKQKDELFHEILVRVSMQENVQLNKATLQWRRLNPKVREEIAQATLYPADFLHEQERNNLMDDNWRHQGPRGVPGTDYDAHPFLVWDEIDDSRLFTTGYTPSAGLLFGGPLWGVIPIPEQGGAITLQLAAGQAGLSLPVPLNLRWYGRLALERQQFSRSWQGEPLTLNLAQGGLLLLESPLPLVVRGFITAPAGQQEITPEPGKMGYWQLSAGNPLRFVIHNQQHTQPIPIQMRQRLIAPTWAPDWNGISEAHWRFLGVDDQVLSSGTLKWQPFPSHYDWINSTTPFENRVSDPNTHYLEAPLQSVALELTAPNTQWVAIANRPPGLERHLLIPEDAYPTAEIEPMPTWFPIRPYQWRTLQTQERFQLITQQRRPTADEGEEPATASSWIVHQPIDGGAGRFLLTPRDPRSPPLPSSGRGVGYHSIKINRATALTWVAEPGRREIEPVLIYQRQQRSTPLPLTLILDGKEVLQTQLPGVSGEIQLPKLELGPHTIELQGKESARFYLSHIDRPTHIKRYAERITPGQKLTYQIPLQPDRELIFLSGQLYNPLGSPVRSRITSQIVGPVSRTSQPIPDWTVARRHYDIRAAGGKPTLVLGAKGEVVDEGQSFFIPLGRDLQAAAITIELTLESGPAQYLLLGETTALSPQQTLLFIDEGEP